MRPAFLALAGTAALSTVFAAVEAVAFVAMLAVPVATVGLGEAHAATTLYRWKEADGSLTYSPTAPTDGTPYDTVDPMTMRPAASAASPSGTRASIDRTGSAPVVGAGTTPGRDGDAPSAGAVAPMTPALGAAARPAPRVVAMPAPTRSSAPISATADAASRSIASSGDAKTRRCSELEKRVVSLERRLMTPLTPDAMDETVMQMVRYQQSVDRHCR